MTTLMKRATCLFVVSLFAAVADAQAPSATLVGRIVDASNAAVANAAIRVRNVATNELRHAETQLNGEYTMAALPPGNYEVTVEKDGFKLLRQEHLELQVG